MAVTALLLPDDGGADGHALFDYFNGTHDFDTDNFKMALFNNSFAATTTVTYSTTNELTTANGYTQGGVAMTETLSETGGTVTFDANDVAWTASGGSIGPFRYGVIYNDTDVGKTIIGYIDFDNTPGTITINDGNTFTVQFNASGIWDCA